MLAQPLHTMVEDCSGRPDRGPCRAGGASDLPQCRDRLLRPAGEGAGRARPRHRGRACRRDLGRRVGPLSGHWINDRTHGLQFRANFLKALQPTTLEGIERYLGSGMIRGIGPVYARRLVRAFGTEVFDVIEADAAAPARGGRHRPQARRPDHRRLGRPEGHPRDHAVPARPRRRHRAGGADLQDLRRRTPSRS